MEAEQKILSAVLADGAIYTTEAYRAAAPHARYATREADLLVALERGDVRTWGGDGENGRGEYVHIFSFRQHVGHQRE